MLMKNTITLTAVIILSIAVNCFAADIGYEIKNTNNNNNNEDGFLLELGPGLIAYDIPIIGATEEDEESSGLLVHLNAHYQKNGFFIEAFSDSYGGLAAGYKALSTEDWSIDIIGSQQNFQITSDNDSKLDGLRDRNFDFTAGVRVMRYFNNKILQLEALKDISDTHDGTIVNGIFASNWQYRNWNFYSALGLHYNSSDVVDYYLGVDADEANANFSEYQAASGLGYSVKFGSIYPLNEKWIMHADYLRYKLADAATDSPLVTDDNIEIASLSFRYVF